MEKPNKPDLRSQPCGAARAGACCGALLPYIPMQEENPVRYSRMEALQTGTLFPGLDLPFKAAIQAKTKLITPLWWAH